MEKLQRGLAFGEGQTEGRKAGRNDCDEQDSGKVGKVGTITVAKDVRREHQSGGEE